MADSAARLLSLLDGVVQTGTGAWKARCPSHVDPFPSLSIRKVPGKTLLDCRGGCQTAQVLTALGLGWSDLFDDGGDSGEAPVTASRVLEDDEADFRDLAYGLVMEHLTLSQEDRDALQRRGLTLHTIEANVYRTLNPLGAARAAKALMERWGSLAMSVPGMYEQNGRVRLSQTRGLLVPVRDVQGRIIGAQVRTGDPHRKYTWLSSQTSPSGAPCHAPLWSAYLKGVPTWVLRRGGRVRVTEGPLKADVAFALSGLPTVGVAGVSSWRWALPVLARMEPAEVILAFDADWQVKEEVARQIQNFGDALAEAGYRVSCEVWDVSQGKGIDDLLLAGGRPRLVTAEELELAAAF